MIIGYPSNTERYMTSYEVRELTDVIHPNRIATRGLRQELLMKDMQADPAVNIKYAPNIQGQAITGNFPSGKARV